MATLNDLPDETQKVYLALDREQPKSVFTLVDELGWSQTNVQIQLNALSSSGWIVPQVIPDGSPSGGPCNAYTQKEITR